MLFWGRQAGSIGFAENCVKHGRASDSKQSGPLSSFFLNATTEKDNDMESLTSHTQAKQKKWKENGRTSQPN